ncbi:recombinase family protein [Williamsia deligens]|uniref:Recombinase family protein n=1 Tax=Williamsia deligens TaxID=321325 RepID=A0ABW3G8Z6_9NOCA|nr:recombinase family protein [Williamsia deligens]MCP2195689.1 Site-specific DNA recombinase [Williamsia deligens]
MQAIIYCRVSSDPNQRGKSVDEQERECRAVAASSGWDVGDVLVDNDRGASRYSRGDRPAYARLKLLLAPGDVLITWEASRAQRDLAAYLELRELCAERGVLWSYSGRTYDLTRGDDRFTTGLDALLSEKEVEQTRERVLRAVRANAHAGRPHGKVPFGYRLVRDPDTGESIGRVEHPETGPIFREAFRRVLAGEALYSVCKDFEARGIPAPRPRRDGSPAPWIQVTLRHILESPTYAGLRQHRGVVIGPATWEPLITIEEHQQMLALLNDPARLTHRGSSPRWLLTGIATCGVCGGRIVRAKNRGCDSYMCHEKFCVARKIATLDEFVVETILARLEQLDPAALAATDPTTAAAFDEARALRDRLDDFVDQAAAGELTAASLARIEARLLPQIASAERRANAGARHPLVAAMVGDGAREHWASLDIVERRTVVRSMLSVTIHRAGVGRTVFNPDLITLEWVS